MHCAKITSVQNKGYHVFRYVSGAALLVAFTASAAAQSYELRGGQWQGTLITGAIDFYDEQALTDCLAGESVIFSKDQIARMIDPAGTCEVGDPSSEANGADFSLSCTGGQITTGDVQVTASPDKIEINSNVEFPLDDGSTLDGYILLSMERTGICPAG